MSKFNLREARGALKNLLEEETAISDDDIKYIMDLVITSDKKFIQLLKEEIRQMSLINISNPTDEVWKKIDKLAGDVNVLEDES